MEAHLWCCLLGILCTPAVVIGTVSQKPPAIISMRVNSSAEMQCSTSVPGPNGLSLRGRFHGNRDVVYLSLGKSGAVQQRTEDKNYRGRVDAFPSKSPEHRQGCSITLRLSRLAVDDTDQYICHWSYPHAESDTIHSSGTILIVRGPRREHSCSSHAENTPLIDNFTLVVLSVTSFTVMFFIFIGTLLWRCKGG